MPRQIIISPLPRLIVIATASILFSVQQNTFVGGFSSPSCVIISRPAHTSINRLLHSNHHHHLDVVSPLLVLRNKKSSSISNSALAWHYKCKIRTTHKKDGNRIITSTILHSNHDESSISNNNNNNNKKGKKDRKNPFKRAVEKFKSKPLTYCLIPCIAALVGWLTNWLAVQMIFYPVEYRGLSLIRKEEVPLGLLGWQGIVPCKTRAMSETMVTMVTTQLLSVPEVFRRLDPRRLADLLAPKVPEIAQEIISDVVQSTVPTSPKTANWLSTIPKSLFAGLPRTQKETISHYNYKFVLNFAKEMQCNIEQYLNVNNCVVEQMLQDRTLLGKLFQKCGSAELDFLTNSGLWFGFLLGLIQMVVALFWDNPWSLSIGGGIVGLATNWLALKWIFEPVNPTKIGPFILQGQFLRRQKEVAAEFSTFFAEHILTSEKVWSSIFTEPTTSPAFQNLFNNHFTKFITKVTRGLRIQPESQVMAMASTRALQKLPEHIHVLHEYIDQTLGLRETLRIQMEQMTSLQFERVLHPIFEEDELTLILAGMVLGFLAGLVQQGLETGKISFPKMKEILGLWKQMSDNVKRCRRFPRRVMKEGGKCVVALVGRWNSRFGRNNDAT